MASPDFGILRAYLANQVKYAHNNSVNPGVSSEKILKALELEGMVERDGQFGMSAEGEFFTKKVLLAVNLPDSVVEAVMNRFADPGDSLGGNSMDIAAKAEEWSNKARTPSDVGVCTETAGVHVCMVTSGAWQPSAVIPLSLSQHL